MIRVAPDSRARSATRTTIGVPPRSASGLFGRRVDARRAGMMTVKFMQADQTGSILRAWSAHMIGMPSRIG